MERVPRILFVCTKFGGRSLLATHFCNRHSPWGSIAQASSFDPGQPPGGFFRAMKNLGHDLDPASPPLGLFERYKRGDGFDHVVVMCSEQQGEQCHIFSLSVRELYGSSASLHLWPVPDLSRIAMTDGVPGELARLCSDIEGRVVGLLGQLAEDAGWFPPRAAGGTVGFK